MTLVYVLFFAAFALAAAAGFFSVAGLAITYGGSFASVVALGCTIELGKLVGVSFLYRFWSKIGFALKSTLITLIVGVMLVTSLGVFGFLTKANQTDMVGLKQTIATQELLVVEDQQLRERKAQIDLQISQLDPTDVQGRVRLNRQFKTELVEINNRLPAIAKEKASLSTAQIQQQADIGPMVFLAKSLGYDIDVATTWFTMLLVLVFDPLAIVLTICANIALVYRKHDRAHVTSQINAESASIPRAHDVTPDVVQHSDPIADPAPVITEIQSKPEIQTKVEYDYASDPDVEFVQPITTPIFRDRVVRVVETSDNSESQPQVEITYAVPQIDASDRTLIQTDWNHYVQKKLRTTTTSELAEKLEQLKQYVAELDQRDGDLTDDEIILRSRILNFIDRQQ